MGVRHIYVILTYINQRVEWMPMRRRIQAGSDIRTARQRLGLSIEKAARVLDVGWSTLSRWERGVIEPSPLVLRGIEATFDDYQKSRTRKEAK